MDLALTVLKKIPAYIIAVDVDYLVVKLADRSILALDLKLLSIPSTSQVLVEFTKVFAKEQVINNKIDNMAKAAHTPFLYLVTWHPQISSNMLKYLVIISCIVSSSCTKLYIVNPPEFKSAGNTVANLLACL
jgi:hypothetical protein